MRALGDGMRGGGLRQWAARAIRHRPILVAALGAVWAIVCVRWNSWPGAVLLGLGGLGIAWGAGWRMGLAWAAAVVIAAGGLVWRSTRQQAAELAVFSGAAETRMEVVILKDARGTGMGWSAPARVLSGRLVGAKLWWQGREDPPVAGTRIEGRVHLGPLPQVRNPGEFDRGGWLREQGVVAVAEADGSGWRETGRWARLAAGLRSEFRKRITMGLEDGSRQAQVIRAVAMGESPMDADQLIAAFRNSGTLHVFSVSGLHVAMVASMGWFMLGALGVSRRRAVPILLPLIFGYAWLTGNSSPALRSAWMAAVFLGAFTFRRRPDLMNALGVVLLGMLLWDGRLLFQAGAQLSYGVVAAIAIGASVATRVFAWLAQPELYLPPSLMTRWQAGWLRARRATANSLGVSLAAAVGSAPLTAYHFSLVTPVSILANLVLVPLVFLLLAMAMGGLLLSPVAPLARNWNRLNGRVADVCVLAADAFAAIPFGHVRVGGDGRPKLRVYDLERGAGAACLSAAGAAVLMDCGDRHSFSHCVLPSLRRLGVEPDSVLLSHPDGAHLGGGAQVWQSLSIRQALLPVKQARSAAYQAWVNEAPQEKVRLAWAEAGMRVGFPDGADFEVLYAPDEQTAHASADERVMVGLLHWRGWRLLWTSDAGPGIEAKLLASGRDLRSDVIIAGHHRDGVLLGDPLLDRVKPRLIIASHSQFPASERLDPALAAYWRSRGIVVINQAESGGVTIEVDAQGRLLASGFLTRVPVCLER